MGAAKAKALIAIGYWKMRGPGPQWLADPQRLVDLLGPAKADPAVVRYLRRGKPHEISRGYSWCRFGCGAPDKELGHADLTDGIWIWPEGLAHYVKRHRVPLPEEFLATVRRGGKPVVIAERAPRRIDRSFWNEWYARHCLPAEVPPPASR